MTISPKTSIEQTLKEISKFHFILDEGRKGNHLLFSPETIRVAFNKEASELSSIFEKNLDQINIVLNETFERKSFEEKRLYLETLSPELQTALVFGYFQLLEKSDTHDTAHPYLH